MSASLQQFLRGELERRAQANLYRSRRVIEGGHGVRLRVDGRECVNFCSNDYLGLAADPAMAQALARSAQATGAGSAASQLITGYNAEHAALEEEIADFVGRERALLFSTGYAANMGVISALMGRDDVIVSDALNHASLIDGARLSGAAKSVYPHADTLTATAHLQAAKSGRRLLLSDAVFSMDGDTAPLPELAAVAAEHDAWLMLDDAHGFGVQGPGGRGSLAAWDLGTHQVPVLVATLGKAVGAAGAFVAGDRDLIEYLIQAARPFVFSTAPPPAVAAAARQGLRMLREQAWRREHLHGLIAQMRASAARLNLPLSDSTTAIQPLILGDEARTLAVSQTLLKRGFLVSAIRPPTVPAGSARLRITLSAAHSSEQVEALLAALAQALLEAEATLQQARTA